MEKIQHNKPKHNDKWSFPEETIHIKILGNVKYNALKLENISFYFQWFL